MTRPRLRAGATISIIVTWTVTLQTFVAPTSIPADTHCGPGMADATHDLQVWIDELPAENVVAELEPKCYRIDGTIVIEGRRNFVLDGGGSTLYTAEPTRRTGPHVRVIDTVGVTIENLEIDGGAEPAYDPATEHQHAFAIDGLPPDSGVVGPGTPNRKLTLRNVSANRVQGDFVYVRLGHEIEVVDAVFGADDDPTTPDGAGRQGITIISGTDIVIHRSEVSNAARGIFNIEPNTVDDEVDGVTFAHNTVRHTTDVFPGLTFVANKGAAGSRVEDVEIAHNELIGRKPWIQIEQDDDELAELTTPESYSRRDYRIIANRADTHVARGASATAFRIDGVLDVEIRDNTVELGIDAQDAPDVPAGLVHFRSSTETAVTGNRLPPGDDDGTNDFVASYDRGPTRQHGVHCERDNLVDDPPRPATSDDVATC